MFTWNLLIFFNITNNLTVSYENIGDPALGVFYFRTS